MSGRAGRMGQTSFGESFLTVKANQKQQALQLVNQVLPNILSQMHPEMDGGNALVKAMIDLVGLDICVTSNDLFVAIQETLLYQQSAACAEQRTRISALISHCYQFILENKIIDAKPLLVSRSISSSESAESNCQISTTKFGKAFLKSGLDPDEAIIFYESLLLAQAHLFLDSPLHILYLLSPLDHSFIPDLKRINLFYQKSKKTASSFSLFLESIHLNEQVLHRWQISPPTKAQFDISSQILRLRGIASNLVAVDGKSLVSSMTAVGSANQNHHLLSVSQWRLICTVKRVWSAMILQSIIDGYSPEQIFKEYCSSNSHNEANSYVSLQDLENLQRNSRIILQKLEKFCKEMNWKALMKLFHSYKGVLDFQVSKELKKLLMIPQMPRKIAHVLIENNIKSPTDFVKYSIEEIVQYCQLSLGFELQEIDDSNLEFNSSAIGSKKSRDEMMRERLSAVIGNLLTSANNLVNEIDRRRKEKNLSNQNDIVPVITSAIPQIVDKIADFMYEEEEEERAMVAEEEDPFNILLESDNEDDNPDLLNEKGKYEMESLSSSSSTVDENEEDEEEEEEELPNEDSSAPYDLVNRNSIVKVDYSLYHSRNISDGNDDEILSPPPKVPRRVQETTVGDCKDHLLRDVFMSPSKGNHIHKIKITPFKKSTFKEDQPEVAEEIEYFISDDDLLQFIEEFENKGLVLSEANLDVERPDLELSSKASSSGKTNFLFVPFQNPSHSTSNEQYQNEEIDLNQFYIPSEGIYDVELIKNVSHPLHADPSLLENPSDQIREEVGNDLDDQDLLNLIENWEKNQQLKGRKSSSLSAESHRTSLTKEKVVGFSQTQSVMPNEIKTEEPLLEEESEHTDITQEMTILFNEHPLTQIEDNSKPSSGVEENISPNPPLPNTIRKKSPYLTPFTASKIASPGKYLYYASLSIEDEEPNAEKSGNQPKESRTVDYSLFLPSNITSLPFQSFQVHDLSKNSSHFLCRQFIHHLKTSKFLSFELVFRQFPLKFFDFHRKSSSCKIKESHHGKDPLYQGSWSTLLTYNYHSAVHVTSSHLDNNVKDPFEESSSKNPQSNPLLLTGVTFTFGKLESYFMKLPIVLPLIYQENAPSSLSQQDPVAPLSLNHLPLQCKEKICLFIGFPHYLFQSLPLWNYLQFGEKVFNEQIPEMQRTYLTDSMNPLFLLSKHWCYLTRRLLIIEWRKGGCSEWKFLQEIMNNSKITKLSFNLKEKLQFLRDRDILMRGTIEDPLVAAELLKNSGEIARENKEQNQKSSEQKKKSKFYPLSLLPKFQIQEFLQFFHPQIHSKVSSCCSTEGPVDNFYLFETNSTKTSRESAYHSVKAIYLSSYLSYYCFYCMKCLRQELANSTQLDLFQKIEMPLLSLIADSEFHGMEVNGKLLQVIRNQWQDRKLLINKIFQQFFRAHSFNLETNEDVRKIKAFLETFILKIYGQEVTISGSSQIPKKNVSTQLTLTDCYSSSQTQKGNSHNNSEEVEVLLDWNAGTRKRSFHESSSGEASINLNSGSTAQVINPHLPLSNFSESLFSREKFLELHPFTSLIHEYRCIVKNLPLINSILRYRKFNRIRGDHHTIGTETGRIIITNPPLQHTPKESILIPPSHNSFYEEIMQSFQQYSLSNGKKAGYPSMTGKRLPTEFISMMNQNNFKVLRTGKPEWVKIIPISANKKNRRLKKGKSYIKTPGIKLKNHSEGEGGEEERHLFSFYSSDLILGKLIYICYQSLLDGYYQNLDNQIISSISSQSTTNFSLSSDFLANLYPFSSETFYAYWQRNQYYFQFPSSNDASDPSSLLELIPQVVVEITSATGNVSYQIIPANHLYRVQSQSVPSSLEYQLLHKTTTIPKELLSASSSSPAGLSQLLPYYGDLFNQFEKLSYRYEVRKSLVASPGLVLLTADYSQIELRLLTHFCKDPSLLTAFRPPQTSVTSKKEDIFERLASIYKRKPMELITKQDRQEIKQLSYAVIYGAGSRLISEQMNISVEEAKQLISDFHQRFPKISVFMQELFEECQEKGYVETLFGRKRYLSFDKVKQKKDKGKDKEDEREENWKLISKLQRQVINTLCQGSAADLVKVNSTEL
jgi:hypothetical protein